MTHTYDHVSSTFEKVDAHVKQQLAALEEHYNVGAADDDARIKLDGHEVTAKHKAAYRAAGMSANVIHFVTVLTNYRNFLRDEVRRGADFVHEIVDTMQFALGRMNAVAMATAPHDLYRSKDGSAAADVADRFKVPQFTL